MKLKNIKEIKGYKSYENFSWSNFFNSCSLDDGVNVFFGENGSGKSSIVNLLKSVSNNKMFDEFPLKACLVFDDDNNHEKEYLFSNNTWNNNLHDKSILFFDKEFIKNNIHLGHERRTEKEGQEQKSGILFIEVDNKAINLRKERANLGAEKEGAYKNVTEFKKQHKDILSLSLNYNDKLLYNNLKDKTEEKIKNIKQKLTKTLNDKKKIFENDEQLQSHALTIQKDVENLPLTQDANSLFLSSYETYQAIFNFDLKEQSKMEAEQTLIDNIKANKEFFKIGIEIRKTHQNQCPFCQSENEEIKIKKIVNLYNQIYDTTYDENMQQFETNKNYLLNELTKISQTVLDFDISVIFLKLKRLEESCKISKIYLVEEEENCKKPFSKKIDHLSCKIKSLIDPTNEDISNLYNEVNLEFQEIKEFFKKIYKFVEEKNIIINKFKEDNTIEKINSRINNNRKIIDKIDSILDFINENKIDSQKKQEEKTLSLRELEETAKKNTERYQTKLEEYERYCSTDLFSKVLTKMQDYFKKFDFKFRLELSTSKIGNKNEYPFAFKIFDMGGKERDFTEGLSEGETQVLSLCFFFAFTDIQENTQNKILVFDDPITSLDNNNLHYFVDLIAAEKDKFSQMLIFTHHKTFFRVLLNKTNKEDKYKYTYNIIRNRKELGGSFICKFKCKSFIEKLKKIEEVTIQKAKNGINIEQDIVKYGQYLRYEVEYLIKTKLLQWNQEKFHLLIDGVKKIKNNILNDDELENNK